MISHTCCIDPSGEAGDGAYSGGGGRCGGDHRGRDKGAVASKPVVSAPMAARKRPLALRELDMPGR